MKHSTSYIYIYIFIHTHTHMHMHIHTYTHIHTHIHTHLCIPMHQSADYNIRDTSHPHLHVIKTKNVNKLTMIQALTSIEL